MTKILLNTILFLLAGLSFSQPNTPSVKFFNAQKLEIGPALGFGFLSTKGTDQLSDTNTWGTTSQLGLELVYHFNKYLSVVTIPGLEKRRRVTPLSLIVPEAKNANGVNFVRKTRAWSFPVMLRFSYGKTAGIQAETGLYFNYTVKQQDLNINDVIIRNPNKDMVPVYQQYDGGIVAGVLFFAKKNRTTFFLGHRCYYGKIDIANDVSNFSHFENLFVFVTGFRIEIFDLTKNKHQDLQQNFQQFSTP